jgi:16S rRNA U516 pseudouridylate synthase RsuA-like enzyme
MPGERLSKFLARCGAASRRKAEEIIRSGRVRVNGAPVSDPSRFLDPATDMVTLDGTPLSAVGRRHYIALYKPEGFLSDLADTKGRNRPLARSLIDVEAPLFP